MILAHPTTPPSAPAHPAVRTLGLVLAAAIMLVAAGLAALQQINWIELAFFCVAALAMFRIIAAGSPAGEG